MKRHLPGLHHQVQDQPSPREGLYLVRVEAASYRYHPQKPFFLLRFTVLEPSEQAGQPITARVYCTAKALWKLNWFLREFGYDSERLGRDEVDEKALVGLRGIVKVCHTQLNGRSFLNLDGFAPESQWEEIAPSAGVTSGDAEDPHDL